MIKHLILIGLAAMLVTACDTRPAQPLPILGNRKVVESSDTVFHTIPDFRFVNQDSLEVTNATFEGKAYVVDFFFTNCPTICPKVKKQMLRVYEAFKADDDLLLLSHSIDTKYDTVGRLKQYATNLGVDSKKWHFVTGDKAELYAIAEDYFSVAKEDPDAPGGFDHSGRLILIDKNRLVRSFCDGTDEKSVDQFMKDIRVLLREMRGQ